MTPPVYSEDEAARMLGCTVDTVRESALRGLLVGLKVGRGWVFPARAFEDSLNAWAIAQTAERSAAVARPAPAAVARQPRQVRKPPPLPAWPPQA